MTAAPPANTPGHIGFVLAIVTVSYELITTLVSSSAPLLYSVLGLFPAALGAIFLVLNVVGFLLATATAIFGIVGATRRGTPMLKSGIALGVGVPGAVLGIVGLVTSVLVSAAYGL